MSDVELAAVESFQLDHTKVRAPYVRKIAVEHGPSIHDCALTRHHVVIFDLPVTFSMKALIAGQQFPYRWNAAHRARVGLLRRDGTEVSWHEVDPAYSRRRKFRAARSDSSGGLTASSGRPDCRSTAMPNS